MISLEQVCLNAINQVKEFDWNAFDDIDKFNFLVNLWENNKGISQYWRRGYSMLRCNNEQEAIYRLNHEQVIQIFHYMLKLIRFEVFS